MNSTVLVTGATGKTGRRLVPQLAARGVTVRTASRNPAPADAHVEPVHFDWSDESTYAAALKEVDAVYVVTANLSGITTHQSQQVASLLDAAAVAGARRVVLLSAFGVDQAPAEDPLRRIERVVEEAGMPSTILRPGTFMQNFSEKHWSNLDATIRERDEIAMPGGDALVSYVSTHDIAAVAAVALTEDGHDGKAYSLTGREALTLAEVAHHISVAAGRQVRYVESGPQTIRDALLATGMPTDQAEYLTQLFVAAMTTGAFGVVTDDIAAVTGRPATTFAEYAAGAADAWRRPTTNHVSAR
ncbi:NmrA family NAD(P)-binding protein [Streptosporangium saharense]|uniref:NmrA family NAD(P)-binding protein n=1 Tax=Streptosporangium saharense TaxID=1706840 RepID=UPI003333CBA8